MALQLVVGDRNCSSWSLRAALAVELAGAVCDEVQVRLYQPDSRARLLRYSPTGKVPVLVTEQGPIWDSLAIAENLDEVFPGAQLWPQEAYARAVARSACAEMHSGFVALRRHLPMDQARDQALIEVPDDAMADIVRICALWADYRTRFGKGVNFCSGRSVLPMLFMPRLLLACAVTALNCLSWRQPTSRVFTSGRLFNAGIRQL